MNATHELTTFKPNRTGCKVRLVTVTTSGKVLFRGQLTGWALDGSDGNLSFDGAPSALAVIRPLV